MAELEFEPRPLQSRLNIVHNTVSLRNHKQLTNSLVPIKALYRGLCMFSQKQIPFFIHFDLFPGEHARIAPPEGYIARPHYAYRS